MGVFIDILGKRFGKLVAIERISDGSYGKWKFKCDCGQEKIISKQNVTQGKVKSCGCLNKERGLEQRLSLIGRHFGSLEIIGFNNGHSKSCGCNKIYKHKRSSVGLSLLYYRYKNRAKRYNRIFDISLNRFEFLTKQKCFYCGSEPTSHSKNKSDHSDYIYNGLDRIDSQKGYIEDNVVTCCVICNRMKSDYSIDKFINHIKKIYEQLNKRDKIC